MKLSPFENMLEQTPVFSPPFSPQKTGTSAQQSVMLPRWSPEAFGLGGAGNIFSFDPCAQNKSPEGKITYYVRLIPMSNGEAVGKPSNTVKLTYDPNGEIKITFPAPPPIPPWTYYDVEVVKFTGVHAPNYTYAYCVEIVENNNLFASFEPGDKLCPKSFKGGNEDGFLELVKSAVNFVSNLYNKLSNWATELVDKLNPMCKAEPSGPALAVAGGDAPSILVVTRDGKLRRLTRTGPDAPASDSVPPPRPAPAGPPALP